MALISTGLGLAEKANLELCIPVYESLFSLLAQADDFGGDELVQVNWIEEITKGGITMIFIGLLSVIGVAILIERLFFRSPFKASISGSARWYSTHERVE